ncbi:MAG TPA: O-antigen ligase family protein [Solirubrobacterales bacterium]|nr:O-antigen ligase family protein [Solirubrobacterales bacterium]
MNGTPLEAAVLLVASGCAAAVLVAPRSRFRTVAMLAGLAICPILVVGDQWSSTEIEAMRDEPGRAVALAAAAAGLTGALAVLFARRPRLVPLAIVAALPFRIPLEAGGEDFNLLVPLYVVLAAAAIAGASGDLLMRSPAAREAEPEAVVWLRRLLAAFVLAYALQSLYSEDFSNAVKTACFFLVPFSALFVIAAGYRWDRRVLLLAVAIVVGEALAFAVVGFAEWAVRDLLWNPEVITSNEFHVYFRANSLFWDPNVFGRYLALAIVLLAALILWSNRSREILIGAGLCAVLLLALFTTFSQSSFIALLAGLATLAALRWNFRWTGVVVALAVAVALGYVVASGMSLDDLDDRTAGREGLISGGLELFSDRPLWGYGSGSFAEAFIAHVVGSVPPVSESHNEPVTVAAEQGLVGLALFVALLAAAFAALGDGLRRTMPGFGGPGPGDPARAAILAAFVALLVHTLAYAGFFEDPMGWLLMGLGAALATASRRAAP